MQASARSISFIAIALASGLPVYAQTAEAPTEIIVTARRIEERLEQVPISISVLNQRQLTNRNISVAGDLASYIPSLSVSNQFGSESTTFILRGFAQDIGTSPTVGTYFADVVSPRGGFEGTTIHAGEGAGPGNFFDLDSVQVLKGPQGTLFGRNTTGGAILLVPKKPTTEFGGYFEISGGNYDMERLQAVVNLPVNEKVRLRLGFDQQTRNGTLINTSGIGPKDLNNINYIAGRASLVADITDDLQNYTIGSFLRSDNNGTNAQLFACLHNPPLQLFLFAGAACAQLKKQSSDPYAIQNDLPNPNSYLRQWQIINTTTWDATDNLTVKNIASYSEIEANIASGLFGDNFQIFGHHIFLSGFTTVPNIPMTSQLSYTEELQFQGHDLLDGRLTWQAGLYTEGSDPIGLSGTMPVGAADCSNIQAFQCTDVIAQTFHLPPIGNVVQRIGTVTWRDYAVYAQSTYSIFDNLKLTAGIRWTDDSMRDGVARYEYFFPKPNQPTRTCELPLPPGDCFVANHTSSRAPTGEIDLDYTPVEDVMTYIKYARGYRQGGVLSTGPIGFETYQPEQVDMYEAGVKTSFRGEVQGYLNAALFYNDFSQMQILGQFVNTRNRAIPLNAGVLNAGSSRIWGFELESTVTPYTGLTFDLAYTYLNSRLNSANAENLTGGVYDHFAPASIPGSPLQYSPRHKVAFEVTYLLPLDESLGKITIGATDVYTGSQLVQTGGPYTYLPAYNLLNFNLNWESIGGSPFDAEFFMTNATDEVYYTYLDDFTNFAGFASRVLGEPRMFGGRLRVHF